jgi:tricorn protease
MPTRPLLRRPLSSFRSGLLPAILAAVLALPSGSLAQEEASWLRYPAISPDGSTLAFTWRGDLYRVPAAGGTATALTVHGAHDFMPVWSPDGTHIVFASDRFGNFDLFRIPVTGGEAVRLTFHSADEFPYAFSPDGGSVVFGAARLDAESSRLYPTASQPELYQVPVSGGRPVQLLTSPAQDVAFGGNGRWMLYHDQKGGENAWRKHQRSAIARDLWLLDRESGAHRQLTAGEWEDRSPVLVEGADGGSIFYLSEESGTFNVHRLPFNPTGAVAPSTTSTAVTRFEGAPVRFLTASRDGVLAFSRDGALHTLDTRTPGSEPVRLTVSIAADRKANDERIIPVNGGIQEFAVAPNGKEFAFVVRGDVFVASVEAGTTRRITFTPERETGVSFSPDGSALVYASERGGRWGIWEARRARAGEPYFFAATLIEERAVRVNEQQNAQPRFSPDGTKLAFTEDLNTLRVLDRASGQVTTLLDERQLFSTGPNHHFEWSPDGRWILFDLSVPGLAPGEVGLVRSDGSGEVLNLTRSGFNDAGARWVLGGRAMLWRSNRDGLRTLAATGGGQNDVYAMFFTQQAWDDSRLSKEEIGLARGDSASRPDSAGRPVELDLEGAATRRVRLTIHSSSLGDALLSRDGETLYYLARFERGLNLWSTALRTRETKMLTTLNANSASMVWDSAQSKIFLLADGAVSTVNPASGARESISVRGEMASRWSEEWEAAFDQVWRRTRDTFYTRSFHGADWGALRDEYAKFLPHISNNHEFAELLSEMLGELNVSHSGARYTPSGSTDDATAALGIFWDQTEAGAGLRITGVLRGGPLDRAGVGVGAGAVIEAIDGEEVTADLDPARLLNRKADRNVLLRIREGGAVRDVVVKAVSLAEENRLRYERWVEQNRAEVAQLSGGRLGYVHIPGMNDGAYRTTFEDVLGRHADAEGLVVDTRFNGGGDLVADLEMFLSGRRFFDYTTDTRSTGFEPNFRWTRPSVALANEANYSDGHCFAWAYQTMAIGPLIGMPVPGTCTFGGWQNLPDGVRWGVPGMGVKDVATGRFLENWQTEPDIRVAPDPAETAGGRDAQLERAVQELLGRVGG